VATIVAAIVGLQLGAFGVVAETVASGISSLPFATFVYFMQPVHLAIGVVEGFVTAAIVVFVHRARPEMLRAAPARGSGRPLRRVLLTFLAAAALTGGVLSWFASKDPDGLEWSIAQVTGRETLPGPEEGFHARLAAFQERVAMLPDYAFSKTPAAAGEEAGDTEEGRLGSSVSGLVGGAITLLLALLIGFLLKWRVRAAR